MARPARSGLLSPTAYLRRTALRQGVLGGNRSWVVIGAFVYGPRLFRKFFGRSEQVVAIEKLEPGQFIRIEALKPQSKADRKAAKRAS